MRQLVCFMEKIRVRTTTKEYYHFKFLASLQRVEMPSLESILGVASEDETEFSEAENTAMEAHALKLFEEKQRAASVRRSINQNQRGR